MCDRCRIVDFVIPRHTMICVVFGLPEAAENEVMRSGKVGRRGKQKRLLTFQDLPSNND